MRGFTVQCNVVSADLVHIFVIVTHITSAIFSVIKMIIKYMYQAFIFA